MLFNNRVQSKHSFARSSANNHIFRKNSKSDFKLSAEKALQEFIKEKNHPCLSAQSVYNNQAIELETFENLGSKAAAILLGQRLTSFLSQERDIKGKFVTFIAVFKKPSELSEVAFEALLWKQLSLLNELDEHPWDKTVKSDPDDPKFSFSFGGTAFYIIGLHPGSSRKARQFKYPALVFNLHSQFESLREEGKYQKMRDLIRERDKKLQGNVNPMMEDHGSSSEAKQYSGRQVDVTWKCPFHHK